MDTCSECGGTSRWGRIRHMGNCAAGAGKRKKASSPEGTAGHKHAYKFRGKVDMPKVNRGSRLRPDWVIVTVYQYECTNARGCTNRFHDEYTTRKA